MKDRFTEAELELQEKSPFVCASCGHPQTIRTPSESHDRTGSSVHDRFTEAVKEEAEKNAFICESCGKSQVVRSDTRH